MYGIFKKNESKYLEKIQLIDLTKTAIKIKLANDKSLIHDEKTLIGLKILEPNWSYFWREMVICWVAEK